VQTGLPSGVTYYYRIQAVNQSGASAWVNANPFPITTPTTAPANAGIFGNNFNAGLAGWAGQVGNVQVSPLAEMGPDGTGQGLVAVLGTGEPVLQGSDANLAAYVHDDTPAGERVYSARFYFNPNGTLTGDDSPIDIFAGVDGSGEAIFGVQYQSEGDEVELRGWALADGQKVYTDWEDITNEAHVIEIAWVSGSSAGLSLYIDESLAETVSGDTSAYQLEGVLLGPSAGVTEAASGTMYFDEFVSERLNGVSYNVFLPVMDR
jgi:hypothetical protein